MYITNVYINIFKKTVHTYNIKCGKKKSYNNVELDKKYHKRKNAYILF